MQYFLWCTGRALQLLALIQVGAALFLGLATQDTRFEMKLLFMGIAEFVAGLLIVQRTGTKT